MAGAVIGRGSGWLGFWPGHWAVAGCWVVEPVHKLVGSALHDGGGNIFMSGCACMSVGVSE